MLDDYQIACGAPTCEFYGDTFELVLRHNRRAHPERLQPESPDIRRILDELVTNAHNHYVYGDSFDFTLRAIDVAEFKLKRLMAHG
jgi:hypothetical protein